MISKRIDLNAVMAARSASVLPVIAIDSVPASNYLLDSSKMAVYAASADAYAQREARKERLSALREEGLLQMQLRHARELRRQSKTNALLSVWAMGLVLVWVATCLADVRLIHVQSDQAAVIAAQKQEMSLLRSQAAILAERKATK